ncbi:MAG TPA: hypothetical protein PLN21_21585 [Gemmatales bacterium]|nr:hypothetical protein [Gemmatales bacterium]
MMDWGVALSVGLAVVIISELTILGAIILPKVPLEPGKTWRGTVTAVSTISLIIGGVGGYVAGQFGGRGGGGATTAGQSVVSTLPIQQVPVASIPAKIEPTKPVRPDTYLASSIDLYFVRDKESKNVANFTCELVGFRRKSYGWEQVVSKVEAKNLSEFLKRNSDVLETYLKEIPSADQPGRRLRIFLDPFPGEGVYDQLRQQAEKQGWKVDRKEVAWQPEYPSS